jgi:ATP adenylyltransferase
VKKRFYVMKRLYAPWRTAYVQQKEDDTQHDNTPETCIFCVQLAADTDDQFFILKRYEHCAVMLNTFPYNAGHLLIVPYVHIAALGLLTPTIRAEIMEVMARAVDLLTEVLACEGCNIGVNMGSAAGGSILSHLHVHVLPRWHGDTNFLPTLCDTKQISVDLHQIFIQLKQRF